MLFSEFGAPTYRAADPRQEPSPRRRRLLVEEQAAAAYTGRALSALRAAGCLGAMLWCFADYAPATWDLPPLDDAGHERSFGLWRSDGSPKPALDVVEAFAGAPRQGDLRDQMDRRRVGRVLPEPRRALRRLYRRYRDWEINAQVSRPRMSSSGMAAMPLPRSEKP